MRTHPAVSKAFVANAGIPGPTASDDTMDSGQWDAVLAVNLTGTFDVTCVSLPSLTQANAGVIINVSSVGGRFGCPKRSRYATTERRLPGAARQLPRNSERPVSGSTRWPRRDRRRTSGGYRETGQRPLDAAWTRSPPTPWASRC
ncbi:SDR family NAD(P)-dependent oxidoreductase [Streptomyces griseus]|uniref:SDR family NAD(P)-dependent oxidoreductase n=1 Tax=Streptomyces griseus TaxID=1911 RepID=UPI0009A0A9C9